MTQLYSATLALLVMSSTAFATWLLTAEDISPWPVFAVATVSYITARTITKTKNEELRRTAQHTQ